MTPHRLFRRFLVRGSLSGRAPSLGLLAASAFAVVLGVVACKESPADAAQPGDDASDVAAAVDDEATQGDAALAGTDKAADGKVANEKALAQPSYREDAFVLALEGPKQVKVGEHVTFEVVLTPSGGYKVNEEYPIKFQFADAPNVEPAKSTVRRSDGGSVTEKKATLPLKAKVGKAGSHAIGGKLSFSVCTEERCLIEKRDLEVSVDAS